MKKIFFCALTMLTFSACSKKDSDNSNPSNSFSFSIAPVGDQIIKQNTTLSLPVTIQRASGSTENVSLTVTGLTPNMTAGFTTPVGQPDFITQLNCAVPMTVAAGTYPLKIVAVSQSGVTKEQSFNLVVKNENCALDMTGSWNGTASCMGTAPFTSRITGSQFYKITIDNFAGLNISMDATLNCTDGTISMPSKTFSTQQFAIDNGSGTFTDNQMVINYTYSAPGTNFSCSVTYNR